ncbi:MAG: sulfite exporter TauE/SafE family protein [candidate division Zixibacteria bacterium]|nr:sulfite exporter TauE/SafE family protein [candidate division Zixibacteria bacterium]
MVEIILLTTCGLTAGLLGGYLGLGGGIVMVPFLTVVLGMDIKAAVPVSVTAIVVNSLAASNEYLRKGMVDLELVVVLAIFSVVGNITGSLLQEVVPAEFVQMLLTVILLYTAVSMLRKRKEETHRSFVDNRSKYFAICALIALLTGVVAALVGIGGGVILVPMLYMVIGVPLSTARGTSSLMIGFSAAAATVVYLLNGRVDLTAVAPVIVGIIVGGKLGGYLGTLAKPRIVKIVLFVVMVYLAYRLSSGALAEIL